MQKNVMNNLFWQFYFNIKQNPKYIRSWVFLRPTCGVGTRQAWPRGRVDRWRELYHGVKQAIRDAKRGAAQAIEDHSVNSSKFASGIRNVFGFSKRKIKLDCFEENFTDAQIGVEIRNHFTSICTKYPKLDLTT